MPVIAVFDGRASVITMTSGDGSGSTSARMCAHELQPVGIADAEVEEYDIEALVAQRLKRRPTVGDAYDVMSTPPAQERGRATAIGSLRSRRRAQ
jgi:hypothetical protein